MCRSIKPLFNFEPPASDAEINAAALQFVRKISGFAKPSKYNEAAFNTAVEQVAGCARTLLGGLHTNAPLKNREAQAGKARLHDRRFEPSA